MAYTLKSVQYMDKSRHILLQNSNGPCPLLAAANALLLQGTLSLPSQAIRSNVASISDVVNLLAEKALKEQTSGTTGHNDDNHNSDGSGGGGGGGDASVGVHDERVENDGNRQYHIDEMMQLFPSLQYGMDVNPKFTMGPTGYEYTIGVSVFDLMGVELVHGWLVEDQDVEVAGWIGSRTYNELVEVMIRGNEAKEEMEKIVTKIDQLKNEETIKKSHVDVNSMSEDKLDPKEMIRADVDMDDIASRGEVQAKEHEFGNMKISNQDQDLALPVSDAEQELAILELKLEELTQEFHQGQVVGQFLSNTSTQLTYSGLTELHNHVKEGTLCVFFRNNHFATMTKHDGILYLLVTDLGYANVPEVMWEKLDDINGDTEYADQNFVKTKPRKDISPGMGPSLSPEELLAQSNITEADYQLALQLSRNERAMDEQEGKMIAAATEASLHAYNMEQQNSHVFHDNLDRGENEFSTNEMLMDAEYQASLAQASLAVAREEEDRMMAMRLQAQYEEDAARESRMSRGQAAQQQPQSQAGRNSGSRRQKKKNEGCIIS